MKALKLSKVPRAATPMVARRPPFGASGLTHSNALKSGGYLSSPNAARPWLGPSAATPMEAPGAARGNKIASSGAGFGGSMKHALTARRMIAISRRNGPRRPVYGPLRPFTTLYGLLWPSMAVGGRPAYPRVSPSRLAAASSYHQTRRNELLRDGSLSGRRYMSHMAKRS